MSTEILIAVLFGGGMLYFAGRRPRQPGLRRDLFGVSAGALFLAALILRLWLAYTSEGFSTDIDTFKAWGSLINTVGFSQVYQQDVFLDYPPGYLYVLSFLDHLRRATNLPYAAASYTLLLKLPALLADLVCGGVLLWLGERKLGEKGGLFLAAAYLFCPAVFINSAQWGQVDSVTTALLLASVLLLYRESYLPSALLYGLSIACKPQMIVFAPLYLFFAIKRKRWVSLGLGVLAALAMILLTALPFTESFDFRWLPQRYMATMDYYNYYSVNAYNFWAVIGWNWRGLPEGGSLQALTLAAPAAATAACGVLIFRSRRKDVLFACPAVLMTVMYLFGIKMHERYLYPVFLFLLLCFVWTPDKRLLRAYGAVTAANYLNVAYVLYLFREYGGNYDPNAGLIRWMSVGQVAAAGYLLYVLWSVYLRDRVQEARPREDRPWQAPAMPGGKFTWQDWAAVAVVTLLYGLVAFWNLGGHEMALTSWTPREGDSVVLHADADCDRLYYLPGIAPNDDGGSRFGADVLVETSADGRAWSPAGNIADGSTYVFAWAQFSLPEPVSWVRLTARNGSVVLNEAAMQLSENRSFAAITAEGPGGDALIDEQAVVPAYTTYENSSYFDEIYHARTAYEHILELEPYENTHPPLGKQLISLGVRMFGMNPFGWRFMGALFGVLMLPALYHLLKQLFGSTLLCTAATLWFAFDFMHFTQTRIATIDTYAVFFLLLMYDAMVSFLRRDLLEKNMAKLLAPLGLCGVFTGLGIASKWTAAYGALGLAVLFFGKLALSFRDAARNGEDLAPLRRRSLVLCLWCCLFFLVIPFGICFAAYLPMTTLPHNVSHVWDSFWNYQVNMFNYHSQLKDEHYFASPWYEWPLVVRPIWYFSGNPVNGMGQYSTIAALGNPALWWPGIPAMAAAAAGWARNRRTWAAVALCGFGSVYLPWVLVPRLTFIYHYFTAVPFLVVAVAGAFGAFRETRAGSRRIALGRHSLSVATLAVCAFTAINLLLFCIYYPVVSGLPVNKDYTDGLRLFSTWYF